MTLRLILNIKTSKDFNFFKQNTTGTKCWGHLD